VVAGQITKKAKTLQIQIIHQPVRYYHAIKINTTNLRNCK